MKNNRKGFTLIELLVVVLILGILAAMAMPQYFKAVERSRMSEAVSLLSSIASAQQRKFLQINKYAGTFAGLDVAPAGVTGATFHTKGTQTAPGNGFLITLDTTNTGDYDGAYVTAKREAASNTTLNYKYSLARRYDQDITLCAGENDNGKALCADFCGIDKADTTCCTSAGAETCTFPGTTTGGVTGG